MSIDLKFKFLMKRQFQYAAEKKLKYVNEYTDSTFQEIYLPHDELAGQLIQTEICGLFAAPSARFCIN
jgi:hypothetical protein